MCDERRTRDRYQTASLPQGASRRESVYFASRGMGKGGGNTNTSKDQTAEDNKKKMMVFPEGGCHANKRSPARFGLLRGMHRRDKPAPNSAQLGWDLLQLSCGLLSFPLVLPTIFHAAADQETALGWLGFLLCYESILLSNGYGLDGVPNCKL